jgi:hypothetical protein
MVFTGHRSQTIQQEEEPSMNSAKRPVAFVAVILIFLLAACQMPAAPTAGDTAAGGEGGETIELLYMTHDFDPASDLNNTLIAEFTEMHPNVEIVYDHAPHESYEQKVLTAYAGGEGPDIFWAGDWMMPQFIEQNIIAPVNYSVYGVNSASEYEELFSPNFLKRLACLCRRKMSRSPGKNSPPLPKPWPSRMTTAMSPATPWSGRSPAPFGRC